MARNHSIVINVDLKETRVAIIEDGVIAELHIERAAHRSTVGNVVLGKVTRVLPGMQAAFIEVGQERAAFLHVEDLIRPDDFDAYMARDPRGAKEGRRTAKPSADELLEEQEALAAEASSPEAAATGAEVEPPGAPSTADADGEAADVPEIQEALEADDEEEEGAAVGLATRAELDDDDFEFEDSEDDEDSEEAEDDADISDLAEELDDGDVEDDDDDEAEAFDDEVLDDDEEVDSDDEAEALDGDEEVDSDDEVEALDDDEEVDSDDEAEALDCDDDVDSGDEAEAVEGDVDSDDDLAPPVPDAAEGEDGADSASGDSLAAGASADDGAGAEAPSGSSAGVSAGDVDSVVAAAGETETEESGAVEGAPRRGRQRRRRRRGRGRSGAEGESSEADEGATKKAADAPASSPEGEERSPRGRRRRGRGRRRDATEGKAKPQAASKDPKGGSRRVPARVSRSVPITEVVKEGDQVVVQISKEPIGTKGARVTSHVSLPGRYAVYLPTVEHIGISKRIGHSRERSRLRKTIEALKPETGGLIVRTVAEGLTKKQLKADVGYLIRVWAEVGKRKDSAKAPEILYEELDLVLKMARDFFTDEVDHIIIDDRDQYGRLHRFIEMFMPQRVKDIKMYGGEEPIFDAYGIEDEIKRALGRKVPLPSGGSLIVDQAEALTAIDVNTGRYVGKGSKDLEETALKTNLEAVDEIAYQLRFRNIGGLVILDLIDMERAGNREKVWRALEQRLAKDKAKTTINRISDLGLIEMTRKRTRESLGRIMHEACFYCDGTGHIQSRETIGYEILRQIRRERQTLSGYSVRVQAHPAVVDFLKFESRDALQEAERRYMRRIELVARQEYHIEQYDLQGK